MNPVFAGKISTIFDELKHCDKQITPACLRALYKFVYPYPLAGNKNSYGIVEYTPQAVRLSFLYHCPRPHPRHSTFPLTSTNFSQTSRRTWSDLARYSSPLMEASPLS